MDVGVYDAQADTINVDDIATNSNNRFILKRIKRNDADDNNELHIQNLHDDDDDEDWGEESDYSPEGADDMGWLGYFVGKNEHLDQLFIKPFTPLSGATIRDVIEPFFKGVSNNRSIRGIYFSGVDLLGGEMFTMLDPFFKANHNLTDITVIECNFGDEGCRLFALAIGSSTNKSLKQVDLQMNNITDEGMVDIITALSLYPNLQRLNLSRNCLRKNGCVALATLLRCSATELTFLNLSNNEINNEGLEAFVPALTKCIQLRQLLLNNNLSITTRGWQSLATILEAPNFHLAQLYIHENNNVDNEAVTTFAGALANNHTLNKNTWSFLAPFSI